MVLYVPKFFKYLFFIDFLFSFIKRLFLLFFGFTVVF